MTNDIDDHREAYESLKPRLWAVLPSMPADTKAVMQDLMNFTRAATACALAYDAQHSPNAAQRYRDGLDEIKGLLA